VDAGCRVLFAFGRPRLGRFSRNAGIIDEVLRFVQVGSDGPTLQPALSVMSQQDPRIICIKLLSRWGRGTLMRSTHPHLPLSKSNPWRQRLVMLVSKTPELDKLLELNEDACRFASSISREERQRINDHVRAHYHPPLFRKAEAT